MMTVDFSNHPCFNADRRHATARVHLPVAPQCNVQCRFCNRKFDCVNESRPGVSSGVLSPAQAVAFLHEAVKREPRIAVVGIAGPGDPLANAAATLATLEMVHTEFPHLLLCVATNGLCLPLYAEQLARLGVSHVTVTVNAVDPEIGEKVYAWVRDGIHPMRGREAATLLLNRQIEGIRLLKQHGVLVKINTILIPGVNEGHIEAVASKMSELGADILNCIPLMPVAGSAWEDMPEPSPESLDEERAQAARYLPQMRHCTRCRADALGLLGGDPEVGIQLVREFSRKPLHPSDDRPYVAVASLEGVLVNQHLGEASHLWIFGREGGEFRHLDSREVPEPGQGEQRWVQLAAQLHDCHTVLVSRAGEMPRNTLAQQGIKVIETEGMILSVLQDLYSGKAVAPMRRERPLCGTECGGNGFGCA